MSKLNRKNLQKLLLQEFKMMGMADMQPMGKIGAFSQGYDDMGAMDMEEDSLMRMRSSADTPMMGSSSMGHSRGQISREDCCAAVMSMIECCSCPVTKQALMECCEDIMAGDYD